ncbi:hypothetical protein Tco_0635275 [Tanacetum coccineum]
MANIRTCNKHNMIACVEKTAHNADFYQIIDYLTGCSINYSLLVDPDLIGPWLQQFWATASLRIINEVPHIRAMVAGKRVLISEETIRADLLFDDADGVDCFPKQVIWDSLRDIGYEVLYSYIMGTIWGTKSDLTLSLLFEKNSPKFSGRITPLTPPMLEVITALAAEEAHSESTHSQAAISPRDAQGTPSQSAAQDSSLQGTVASQGTASLQGTAESQGTTAILKSPNDYTPTDAEVRRLKKQTLSQAKQIHKLKAKLKKLSKFVQPVVKHHALWVESQNLKKRRKRQRKKHKKKVSSVKVGRHKDEGTLSEEHYVQEDYTADVFFEDIVDRNAVVTPDLERKSDETEEINVEEKEASNVKSGDIEELDLETFQSTARQSIITPRTLNFDDDAGLHAQIRPTQERVRRQFKVDEVLADISLNISRPRGLSIPGPIQSQPQQPTQATDPKDKGKGILVEETKNKKLTLQQIRALETTNDEEVARKIQAEWDAEEERKRLEELKKAKSKTILKKPTSLAQERNQMMNFLKGQGYKNLQKLRYPQMKELYDRVQESIKDSFKDFIPMGSEKERQLLQERDAKRLLRKRKATIFEEKPSKKLKLRTETVDALRNYLRIVDFEQNAQDRESQEAISVITEFKVITHDGRIS